MVKNTTEYNPAYGREETLNYLSITKSTLYRRMQPDTKPTPIPQPSFKIGKSPFWRLSALNEYLDQLEKSRC